MNYNQFKNRILDRLNRDIPDPKEISLRTVVKNNGIRLDSIAIMQGDHNVSPTLYLEHFYHEYLEGEAFQVVYEHLLETYREHTYYGKIDVSMFSDFQNVKDNIAYKLIHKEKNAELLKELPHIPFLDLAMVAYVLVDFGEGLENATLTIRNEHLDYWKITEKELFDCARENSEKILPAVHMEMFDLFRQWKKDGLTALQLEQPIKNHNMLVLSNQRCLFGAATMLYKGVLEEISGILGDHLYIIPSSVHEVLIVPEDEEDSLMDQIAWINCMIQDINETQVRPGCVLSDHVYLYSGITKKITMFDEEEK